MKWLQDNPLGIAFLSISGVLLLTALLLAFFWTRPVKVEVDEDASVLTGDMTNAAVAHEVGPYSEYVVINQKPVFNESRLPEIIEIEESEPEVETIIEVRDPPDVKLTGVVITPGLRMVSLTPASGAEKESVMVRQGGNLTGEYVGWLVKNIKPRSVLLESRNGEKLKLDLEVHDAKINAPPKPKPPPDAAQAAQIAAQQQGQQPVEAGQPTDRAEEIRRRIAERREELRREQELKQEQAQQSGNSGSQYQQAIQAMMNNNRRTTDRDDQNE